MKNIIKIFVITILAVGGLTLHAQAANAYAQFNNDPQDPATLTVSNYTQCPSCTNWAHTATASSGDVVSLDVYYHNTGTEPADNVEISVSPSSQSGGITYTFNASVSASNASTVSGTAVVNLDSDQTMTYIPGSAKWFPNQETTGGQTVSDAVVSGGISIGDVAQGWPAQGNVRVQFRVGQTTPPPQTISVTTNNATNITQNSATLNGYVTVNGNTVSNYFQYSTESNLTQSTSAYANSAQSSDGPFTANISGLSANTTYYYEACAVVSGQSPVCGSILSFVTTNQNNGSAPQVTTESATNVTSNSATLNGYVTVNGGSVTEYFNWGTDSGNLYNTLSVSGTQSSNANFSNYLSGLSQNTTYYFQACATSTQGYGNNCGSILSFYTSNGNNNNGSAPQVTTESATNVINNSATLNGYVSTNGSVTEYFNWGTDQNNLYSTLYVSGNQSYSGNFSAYLSGLNQNTTYYFQACATSTQGYGNDCGQVLSFYTTNGFCTNGYGSNCGTPTNTMSVATLAASGITQSSALLNGIATNNNTGYYYNSNTATGWFEWGTTYGLGSATTPVSLGTNSSANFWDTISGLAPNTTYYFRADAQNGNGQIYYGDILSFVTTAAPIVTPTPVIYPAYQPPQVINRTVYVNSGVTAINTTGTGNPYFVLTISDRYDTVYIGDTLDYTITYKNISNKTLQDAVLRIEFPKEISYLNSSAGDYSPSDNAVTIDIGTIVPNQTATYDMEAAVGHVTMDNQLLVTTAKLVFTDPSGAQQEATAYALNHVLLSRNSFPIFGFNSFLPTTLLGWFILLLIIFAIVYLARKIALDSEKKEEKPKAQ